MSKSINLTSIKHFIADSEYWHEIKSEEDKATFKELLIEVERSLKKGTRASKGKSLEDLMTFIYSRFVNVEVKDNLRTKDNQIDHEILFSDFGLPNFIQNKIGIKLIGESKNHKSTVSSREVDNLDGLLRVRDCKMGIISSYYNFSRGRNSVWVNGEGKRRKLCLMSKYKRIIIGFHYQDFNKILNGENFYTMIKQKYHMLIDEIADDYIDDSKKTYPARVYDNLLSLSEMGIIPKENLPTYKENIINKYGSF